jgi:hypothetical protein
MLYQTRLDAGGVGQGRKAFFSEEKNQKTFACAVAVLSGGTNT